jgi:signal transduction histidine kinase
VAHEFNNLLTVAQGHLQLLIADHPDEPATVADLEEALKATQRAGELTRDLLSFAGRQLLIPRPLELSSFLRDSMGMVEALLVSPVTLETTVETNVCVRADPTYLRDVLLSLTQFCVERMPRGGILRVGVEGVTLGEPLRVEGGKLPRGDWGVLFVGDSGGPIPRHLRQRLFEPFGVTLDLPSTSHLGMSAAYGIVEQSGGGIRLDVEGDRGARFIVYMPRIPRLVPEETAEDVRTRPDADSIAERASRSTPPTGLSRP